MAAAYPVVVDLERPATFGRAHVVLRVLLLVVASILTGGFGWFGLAYLLFPVLAAVFISQKGGARFLEEDAPRLTRWLGFVVALVAYIAALTDRLPGGGESAVRFEVERSGSPTVGSALLRLLYAIPSAIVVALLGVVAAIVWVVAAIAILVSETYPESLWRFQLGVVRWQARLFGYLASLVEPYPPFSFDTRPTTP
jgi:hypothetical protein